MSSDDPDGPVDDVESQGSSSDADGGESEPDNDQTAADVQALIEEVKHGSDSGDEPEVSISGEPVGGRMVPDPLYAAYGRLLQQMASLPELPMRAALVDRVFESFEPRETIWCIDQILRAALWGRKGAMEAMMATSWWLLELRRKDEYELIKAYYEEAYKSEREAVLDLFREVPPHRALGDGQELPEVQLPHDKDEVTLGERKMMAAGPQHRLLKRLLMDPDPMVIRKLLDNPHIQLDDVVEIASRRPTTAEILEEIIRHPRWFRQYDARVTVVRNPYVNTGQALKLLPTLGIKTLRRIKFSGDLHELVQQSAERLVTLREEKTAPWRV